MQIFSMVVLRIIAKQYLLKLSELSLTSNITRNNVSRVSHLPKLCNIVFGGNECVVSRLVFCGLAFALNSQ